MGRGINQNWSEVKERHDKAIIIAGGESLTGYDFEQLNDFDGAIITVNSSVLHLPRVDYFITIDFQARPHVPHKFIEKRRKDVKYYCGYPTKEHGEIELYSTIEGGDVHYLKRTCEGGNTLVESKDSIRGCVDSLYAALNLAYHFEVKELVLLGADVYGQGHWYDKNSPYNGRNSDERYFDAYKQRLVEAYRSCVPQLLSRGIIVVNGSRESRLDCFYKTLPQEATDWILR